MKRNLMMSTRRYSTGGSFYLNNYKRIAVVSGNYCEQIKRQSKYNCSRIMILQSNDLLERPKSRFDYTLFDLTLEVTPLHDVDCIIMPPLCRRFNFLSLGESVPNCLNSSDLYYSQKYIKLHRITGHHHYLSLVEIILTLMMQNLILIYSKAGSKELKKYQLKWTNDLNASQMLRWWVFEDSAPSWHGRWWSLFHNPWRIWLWLQTHNYVPSFLNRKARNILFFCCFSQLLS